jgi:thioredoxin-dependent peroxiredoxin
MKAKSKKKTAVKSKKKTAKKVAKKSVKKATKKAAKKAVKKATKKVVKKATKKAVAKKATKKSLSKKSAPKVAKKGKASKPAATKAKAKAKKIIKKAPVKPIKKAVAPKAKVSKPSPKIKTPASVSAEPVSPPFQAHKTALKAGDPAPFFEGDDQNGQHVNLGGFAGKKLILYFYPKDDTPGCTAEACSLRDDYSVLGNQNYAVVGVSADDQDSHAKFAAKYELPFPLIADTEMAIIKAYDVWGTKMFMGKVYDGIIRTTFIIDENGMIEKVITDVDTKSHAQQILAL